MCAFAAMRMHRYATKLWVRCTRGGAHFPLTMGFTLLRRTRSLSL